MVDGEQNVDGMDYYLDMWPETEDRETRRSRLENATAWGSAQTEYSGTNFAITDRSIPTPLSNGTLLE